MLHKIFKGLLALVFVFGIMNVASRTGTLSDPYSFLSGLFFAEKIAPDVIRAEYVASKLKVLIVPGHEQYTGGTIFKDITERDLVLKIGKYLQEELEHNPHLAVQLIRDGEGDFAPWFKEYMAANRIDVQLFRKAAQEQTKVGMAEGLFTSEVVVDHNEAPAPTALVLYGINKYANEVGANLVLHLHINDYPGRGKNKAGRYAGFAIYVPESQLPNTRSSRAIGESIATELARKVPVSNFKKENQDDSLGLVEDQELIAVGSNGSRDGASMLIEYGYIYEKRFTDPKLRDKTLKDLAHATYLGIQNYFNERLTLSTAK